MAFTNLEIKLKADVKDLKKTLNQTTKEVNKLKSNLEKMSGPLNKMGKALTDNAKLATKLKNIGAKRTKIIENNLKLSLDQIKATEKQLQKAGKLDDKTQKALNKRATLLSKIADKEIAGIKKSEEALRAKNAATQKAAMEAKKVATANQKALEIQKNISVISDKNRRIALKAANVGADAVQKIKNQLKFDLESLDLQREKLRIAKRLNRDVVAGLNKQKALIKEMAAKRIAVIDSQSVQRSTGLLGKLKDAFKRLSVGVVVFNQALELMGKVMRAFRIVFNNTVQKFADFETALVGVSKTTTLAGETLRFFGNDIQALSAKIPATNEELLKIAEVSGQLGVDGRENLLNFADTMTRVAVSTNLTAEAAASDFTKILNVTRTPIHMIDEFASVIVRLGNNFATNEQKITRMTNEVARATTAFNVAAEDTAAFATAMSAMGIRAEIGGSVLARAMVRIQDALVAGGVEMQTLAKITGQTQKQLRKTFSTDATKVTREFLRGLKRMKDEGKLIIPVMAEFGLKGDEVNKVLPPLVANVDSLGKAFKFAREEMKNATALMRESDKQFATLNSRITTMKNAFSTLGTEIGRGFAPLIGALADGLKFLAQTLTIVAKVFSFITGTIALLIKEGKTFMLIMAAMGAATLAFLGHGALVVGVLKVMSLGFVVLAGKIALATVAAGKFVLVGAKFFFIAVAFAAVGAAIEVLLRNLTKMSELGDFIEAVFAKIGNNLTILFNNIGAWVIRLLRNIAGSFGTFGKSIVTQLNTLANELDGNVFKAKEKQAELNKEIEKTAKALDFGFSGKFLAEIKTIIAGLSDAKKLTTGFGKEGEQVAKIFERRAATLAEQAKALRKLAKILKENRLLEFEIQKLRGGGRNLILAKLQADLDIVEARKQMIIKQRSLNELTKEEMRIVGALIKQHELLKEKAAAAIDASRPERVLRALSVDVVFGSMDGFLNGLKTAANLFDEATAGYLTALPRALFEGFSLATEAMQPMFETVGDFFTPVIDTISELLSKNLKEFEEFFGVDLGKIFTDLGDILSDALESTSDFFSGLFDDANADVEGVFGGANNVPEQVGEGAAAVDKMQGQMQQVASLEQQAVKLEFEAAAQLKLAGEALQGAAEVLKNASTGGDKKPAVVGGVGDLAPKADTPKLATPEVGGAAGGAGAVAGGMAMASKVLDAIQALVDFIPQMLDKIANIFTSLTELPMKILEGLDKVFASILKFVAEFIPNLLKVIPEILKSITKFLKELPKFVLALLQEIPGLILELINELPMLIEELVTALISAAPKIAIALIEFMVKGAPKIAIAMIKFMAIKLPIAIVNGIIEGLKEIAGSLGDLFTGGLDFGPIEEMGEKAIESVQRAVTGVSAELFLVQELGLAEKAKNQFKALEESMGRIIKKTKAFFQNLWDKSFGLLSTAGFWTTMQDMWNKTFGKLSAGGFETTFQDIWDKTFGKLSMAGMRETFQPIWDESFGKLSVAGMRETFQPIWDESFGKLSAAGMRETFQPIWDESFGKLSLSGMRSTFQPIWDESFGKLSLAGMRSTFQPIWNESFGKLSVAGMRETFQPIWDESFGKLSLAGMRDTFQPIWDESFGKLSAAGMKETFQTAWDESFGKLNGAALFDQFKPVLDSLWGFVEFFKGVGLNDVGKNLWGFVEFFKQIGEKIINGIKALVGGGSGGFFSQVEDGLNSAFKSAGFAEGGEVKMFANGGPVGTDTVPAMLTPGEFVVNRDAVGALGVSTLNRINEGGRLASGDTNVSVSMTVNTTQVVDSSFIKNRIVPVMRDELKRASVDGSFVMSKRGLR